MRINDNGTDRDMTADELSTYEAWVKVKETENKAEADALASRTAAREALLTKLGITAEEAQLLLGGM